VDFAAAIDYFNDYYYATYEQDAGHILVENLQDTSARTAFSLAGWKPRKDPIAQAVEWWLFDWEYTYPPEQSSALFSVVNYNTTFYQYSEENNYVFDQHGFNTIIKGEATTFLLNSTSDPYLKLNTIVTNITHSSTGVTIHTSDSTCFTASYAICTFSLGVLQNDAITFSPPLPPWKQKAISTFSMGTYTKIFMQFPPETVFWNKSTQFFLYADPAQRGWYPVFQSLDHLAFLPGSGILFCTVVGTLSYKVEAQDDEVTKQEVLAVLRNMFGAENVPLPTAFMYPRWSSEPWAYGSYSNWPPGTSLEMHQNLRANVGRLYLRARRRVLSITGFCMGRILRGWRPGGRLRSVFWVVGRREGVMGMRIMRYLRGRRR
jgi:polyamine oxidase